MEIRCKKALLCLAITGILFSIPFAVTQPVLAVNPLDEYIQESHIHEDHAHEDHAHESPLTTQSDPTDVFETTDGLPLSEDPEIPPEGTLFPEESPNPDIGIMSYCTGSHSFKYTKMTSTVHKVACTKCDYLESESHTMSSSTSYEAVHPHRHYKTCTKCGQTAYTGTTLYPGGKHPGCASCNVHTHSYTRHFEAAHPHREYDQCSCGDTYYTGTYVPESWAAPSYSSSHPHAGTQKCTAWSACTYTKSVPYNNTYSYYTGAGP